MQVSWQHQLERLEALTVADVMSRKVKTVPATATMEEAAALLGAAAASGAPVVDDAGRCVGILSASDFVKFQLDRAAQPAQGAGGPPADDLPAGSVQRCMSAAVETVAPDAPMLDAAQLMCNKHIHRLIVLDDQAAPIGIITTLDVIAAVIGAVDESRQCRLSKK